MTKNSRNELRKGLHRIRREQEIPVYFHKWYTEVTKLDFTTQCAILETLEGKIIITDVSKYSFRFCSEEEFLEFMTEDDINQSLDFSEVAEDKLENKLEIVNGLIIELPKSLVMKKYENDGIGEWRDAEKESWRWDVKGLLKQNVTYLKNISFDISMNEIY